MTFTTAEKEALRAILDSEVGLVYRKHRPRFWYLGMLHPKGADYGYLPSFKILSRRVMDNLAKKGAFESVRGGFGNVSCWRVNEEVKEMMSDG